MALSVQLNGQRRTFEGLDTGATVADVLADLGLRPDRVAVERNGSLLRRNEWDAVRLEIGDRVEIVQFVGGGSMELSPALSHCT